MHDALSRAGGAGSDRVAAVVGFNPDDTEAISMLLSLLGWVVVAACKLENVTESIPNLIFYNGKGQSNAGIEAIVTAHANQSVLGILLDSRPPFSGFAIAEGRIHWLTTPLDIEAVEQVVVSAS